MNSKEALEILGRLTSKRNLQDFPIGNQPKQFIKMKIKSMPEYKTVLVDLDKLDKIRTKINIALANEEDYYFEHMGDVEIYLIEILQILEGGK